MLSLVVRTETARLYKVKQEVVAAPATSKCPFLSFLDGAFIGNISVLY
jgi:hypothetical protein